MKRAGAGSAELPAAGAGDIVSIAGIAGVGIADTICSPSVQQGLPPGHIEPPTLRCTQLCIPVAYQNRFRLDFASGGFHNF